MDRGNSLPSMLEHKVITSNERALVVVFKGPVAAGIKEMSRFEKKKDHPSFSSPLKCFVLR